MDFIIDTVFQIFFAFFWIIALVIILIKAENKKKLAPLIIFVPLLMIWTIYCCNSVLKPRFQDISYYINKNYKTTSGKCISVHKGKGTPSFVLEKQTYYYNARVNKIYEGKNYRLKYLPNSKYVIKSEVLK
ncbi:hypothetical protein ACFIJ5_18345 (plasmid) [Haloimpatiens sp. FM7330]|uniref:hypothetical protein n=1 Tax=Haloimpatiens sp. FM7330 TaxID=3298610 RepID=UPI003635B565